ncbi:MAG: KH domain-containing protein [Bdellovibrio sp.]|nr:KH domain-containing protein [Bdellovibrio sp.]
MNAAEKKQPQIIRKQKSTNGLSSGAPHLAVVSPKSEVVELTRLKLEDFLKLVVDFPEEVNVKVEHGERTTIFKVDCTKRNFGKILGSRGKMITSLRNITLAITARHGFRSIVEIPYYAPDMSSESFDSDSNSNF